MIQARIFLAIAFIAAMAFIGSQDKIKTKIQTIDQKAIFPSSVAGIKTNGRPEDENALAAGFDNYRFFNNLKNTEELPISEIVVHAVDDSSGRWAVLIPQTHRYPGTDPTDKKNDSAEVAQNQIYEILDYLLQVHDFGFIMNEGDVFGGSRAGEMTGKVSRLVDFRDALADGRDDIGDQCGSALSEEEERVMLERIDGQLDRLDREIALAGAPYRIAAGNDKIELVGAEDPETYEECSELVRDYMYQKDQLASCRAGSSPVIAAANPADNSRLRQLAALMGSKDGAAAGRDELITALLGEAREDNSAESALFELQPAADPGEQTARPDDPACRALIAKIDRTSAAVEEFRDAEAAAGADAPSRDNNPYSDVTDPAVLEDMIGRSELRIREMVIDQRDKETADNFLKALRQSNSNTGIIQFGSGHEPGLVKELNERGISVMVVRPDEVARRQITEQQAEKTLSLPAAVKKLIQDD